MPRLGVILPDEHALRVAKPDDPVDLVVLRSTLLNPPRAAGARSLAASVHAVHPEAALVPYVWHLVTHAPGDGLRESGTRSLPGEAHRFGHLQDTPEVHAAMDVTLRCAEEMSAKTLLLRTPPSFTPGTVNQARLAAFAEARAKEGIELLWEADGLWEPATTQALARKHGFKTLVPAFDGTGRPIAQNYEHRWLRIDSAGPTERLRGALAEGLAYALEDKDALETTTLLFAGPRGYANLRAFARTLDASELDE